MLSVDSETFGFTITAAARMTRALFEKRIAAAGLGITPAEARGLVHIAASPGARLTQLAERLGVEPMTACGVVDRLERQGLVERQPDPTDRRAKNVTTTRLAEPLIIRIAAEASGLREDAMNGLTADERNAMMSALHKVRRNLESLLADEEQELVAS